MGGRSTEFAVMLEDSWTCGGSRTPKRKAVRKVERASWSAGLSVAEDGVSWRLAGSVGRRLLADRTGVTNELYQAMARDSFVPVRDGGPVLADVVVMLAEALRRSPTSDVLRPQGTVFNPVASAPMVGARFDEVGAARHKKIQTACARVRRHVWSQPATASRRRRSPAPLWATWWCSMSIPRS